MHEKVKNLCEYQASVKASLNIHIISVHEKVKYLCDQCDKQFTVMGSFKSIQKQYI